MSYDITSCNGKECPIKHNCDRFILKSKISGRINAFTNTPYNFATDSCDYFVPNAPDEEAIRLKAYEIWQQAGSIEGKSLEYWLQAE